MQFIDKKQVIVIEQFFPKYSNSDTLKLFLHLSFKFDLTEKKKILSYSLTVTSKKSGVSPLEFPNI